MRDIEGNDPRFARGSVNRGVLLATGATCSKVVSNENSFHRSETRRLKKRKRKDREGRTGDNLRKNYQRPPVTIARPYFYANAIFDESGAPPVSYTREKNQTWWSFLATPAARSAYFYSFLASIPPRPFPSAYRFQRTNGLGRGLSRHTRKNKWEKKERKKMYTSRTKNDKKGERASSGGSLTLCPNASFLSPLDCLSFLLGGKVSEGRRRR